MWIPCGRLAPGWPRFGGLKKVSLWLKTVLNGRADHFRCCLSIRHPNAIFGS
ncbi:MAG: hypothetical protein ACI9MU_002827, partial [Alphaproteobacteria bacterium]